MMPKISPMTSLQTFDTFSLFLTSHSAVFAPYTLRDAIDTKGVISQEVDATPMPSNKILHKIRKNNSMIVTMICSLDAVSSLRKLINAEINKETTVIFTLQRLRFFFGCFFCFFSS